VLKALSSSHPIPKQELETPVTDTTVLENNVYVLPATQGCPYLSLIGLGVL